MHFLKSIAAVILFTVCADTVAAPPSTWKPFISSLHYSIEYPSSWTFASHGPESLDITSSSEAVEGVGISPNEAEIIVSKAQPKPLNELVKNLTRDEKIIGQHTLQSLGTKPDACSVITQTISKDEIGPNTFVTNSRFFCETRDGVFIIALSNWPNDPQKEQYQQIALRMVRSLRVGTANVASEQPYYSPKAQPSLSIPLNR